MKAPTFLQLFIRRISWRSVSLLMFPMLSACTVDTDPDFSRPPPPRLQPAMCTMEYDPVCAQRGSQVRTFANACEARVGGFRIVGRGECRPEPPTRPRPPRPEPAICTMEYDPVCGQRGGRMQTFSNACRAEAEGFRIAHPGECRS
ncbi:MULTISPECIES: Kazal-type serine protease inhibitor domain-containing protein [unclassified Sinorhizobium]|uniref:Kazal-type serine protease inhibitor domain-containing protein n=1 Tax=unclassified Sinorhizobium TaxID=2613772 RepID=UPI0035236976